VIGVGEVSWTAAWPTRTVLVSVSIAVDTGVEVTGSGVSVVVGVTVVVSVGIEVVTNVDVMVAVVVSVATIFWVCVEVVEAVEDAVVVTIFVGVVSGRQLHAEEIIEDLKLCSTLGMVAAARLAFPQTVVVVVVVNETCYEAVRTRLHCVPRWVRGLTATTVGVGAHSVVAWATMVSETAWPIASCNE
jgi:hypothetical protein